MRSILEEVAEVNKHTGIGRSRREFVSLLQE
jgi:hypothetical protein